MQISYLPVSWGTYHQLAQKLAADILDHTHKLDEIVAIGRGGLDVGLILSDFLRIPIASMTIQSYTDIKKQGELIITQKLGRSIRGKNVLLVDDNADSGKTFKRAIAYIKRLGPASITTASVFYKPWSIYCPDFYAEKTTKWILFPHEVAEWITTFSKKMKKEGKSETEIRIFLHGLGYTSSQIAFVRKHHIK